MEKRRFVIGKKEILAGTLALATVSAVIGDSSANAKSPDVYKNIPDSFFRPLVIDRAYDLSSSARIPYSDTIVEFPAPTSVPAETLSPTPSHVQKQSISIKDSSINWIKDPEISWYGPGFYGKRTACGLKLTKDLLGVANRDLPCGTMVAFEWKGNKITIPVVDRGPYVNGRIFDLTGGACTALEHCFTGPINYSIQK